MKELPLAKAYQLLEPGPVVLLATASGGKANVMTMSWHMMVDFEPPLVACIVSSGDYSFAALRKSKECVLAVPSVEIADLVVKIGNSSGRDSSRHRCCPSALPVWSAASSRHDLWRSTTSSSLRW